MQPIDIVGPGALGLHLALSLPNDVLIRLRHPSFQPGQAIIGYQAQDVSRHVELLPLDHPSPISAAIVTTKAYHVEAAVQTIAAHLTPAAEVLLLHNGLGPQANIYSRLSQQVWVGTTTEGALRTGPWQVEHTGRGLTIIGPWAKESECTPETSPLISAFLRSRLSTYWEPDAQAMQQRLWHKLMVNCAINPLTALHDLRNGDLLAAPWPSEWQPLVAEAVAIAQTEGFEFQLDALYQQVTDVMQATAQNYSSMHQDIQHNRPHEGDFILGTLLRSAQKHELSVPRLSHTYKQLMGSAAH